MTGTSQSSVRSAFVAETTPGTIVATPGFTNTDDIFDLKADTEIQERFSLAKNGARSGQAVAAIPVAGKLAGELHYGSLDPILETLLQGAWSTDVLKDGRTFKTVSVENMMPAGEGGTNTHLRYRGVRGVGLTLGAEAGGGINYDYDLIGMGSDDATETALSGATFTDPTADIPLVAGTDVGTITMAGYSMDCFSEFELAIQMAGAEPQPKLGSHDLCGITLGSPRIQLTGAFWLEANMLEKVNAARANHSAFAVALPLGSVSGSKYTVDLPECYFAKVMPDVSAAQVKLPFTINAAYNDAEACTIKITRAVA